ncbi:F-actin-monooxygenase MICAL3 isoform X2 [Nematostella vectensis]|uniref:F-actin-monooxygenase MICAL3 isoform X2 n=1 Tax=Nematostella vectensis TaxID=45351 RepID=UPI00207735B5|nr:F-actin-monooxygenase MICAL3 isoform X2 [Nematostella vectensis]
MDFEDGKNNNHINTKTAPELFDEFIQAGDLMETISVFRQLCESLDINPKNYKTVYSSIKNGLTTWKARSLWAKLDKRAEQNEYKNKPCAKNKVLVIGSGPCGLRSALEAALLGAQVMVIEKRDRFSRNNVLHLWPFLITDLKNLGAKKFYGQFCAGSLDHISIKRLQLILLKVSLLFGVQVHPKCGFLKLLEPKEGQGWRASYEPSSHPLHKYEFDMIVGADGRRQALKFKGKEFRGKLAIGITVNFVNRNTKEEARVEEISGVAFIFNQGFFQDLKDTTGIELENIVYYKDETHYFVMCAKKQSLLNKGVIKKDFADAYELLNSKNVNHDRLLAYAREAADFSTKHQLPHLDFALNHQHKEDVAMFDFTSLYAAEYSIKVYERKGYKLLATIVGDSLLEPFWPTGSGCARGFLGCFDAAWAQRSFGLGKQPMDIIVERESTFRLLAQTTPENLNKNFDGYSINPDSRYPNFNKSSARGSALHHLYDRLEGPLDRTDGPDMDMDTSKTSESVDLGVNVDMLLKWCQKQTKSYKHVDINDMSSSWKDGLAFCAIIHRFRPDLLNFDSLKPGDTETNCKLAFETAEEQLGIPPQISASEMVTSGNPDPLMIMSYISQYYESFKNETPAAKQDASIDNSQLSYKTKSPLSKLSILSRLSRKKEKRKSGSSGTEPVTAKKSKHAKENEAPRSPTSPTTPKEASTPPAQPNVQLRRQSSDDKAPMSVKAVKASNRISLLAEQVFGENATKIKVPAGAPDSSEHCFFCNRWIYLMERLSAEGHFFHRECFKCEVCLNTLRLGAYSYVPPWEAEDERAHFYCRPHYNKMLYRPKDVFKTRREEEESRTQKRHRKTHSAVSFPKDTVDAICEAADRKQLRAKEEPQIKRKLEVEDGPDDQSPKESVEMEVNENPDEKFNRTRTNSGRFKRLEARPLRRSSIASVRKSDKTVRDKAMGYELDDGLTPLKEDVRLSPIKTACTPDDKEEVRPPTPSPASKSEGRPTFAVDITTERRRTLERAHSADEPIRRTSPTVEKKTESKGRKMLDKFHKLGTLERKRRTRRAMYPPLSQVFSPEDEGKSITDPGGDVLPLETSLRDAGITPRRVAINIDDDFTTPDKGVAAADRSKDKKGPSKVPSKDTRRRPTSSGKIAPPPRQTSPTKQATKKTTPTRPPPTQTTKGNRLISPTKELLTNKQQNKANPAVVKELSRPPSSIRAKQGERVVSPKEEKEPVKPERLAGPSLNKRSSTGSPPERKRTLPRVPSGEKPFTPTKESTRIDTKQLGTTFVLVNRRDLPTGPPPPKPPRTLPQGVPPPVSPPEEDGFTGSSEEDTLDWSYGAELRRAGARRYKDGKDKSEFREERAKQAEQAKIRAAMKQRESKRLRQAQQIQRELQELEVKQAEVEKDGVVIEKAIRSGELSKSEEQKMMMEWFKIINRKNAMIRYESELVIHANYIQLEDQQGRLEQEIRELLMKEASTEQDQIDIQLKTKELVDIVGQRNNLVELLDEDRKREQEEDKAFESMLAAKDKVKMRRTFHARPASFHAGQCKSLASLARPNYRHSCNISFITSV